LGVTWTVNGKRSGERKADPKTERPGTLRQACGA